MNFSFTTEQEELRRYTRQWLDENCPLETVRMLMDTERGYDDGHWAAIAEMGWLGMAIPLEWGWSRIYLLGVVRAAGGAGAFAFLRALSLHGGDGGGSGGGSR